MNKLIILIIILVIASYFTGLVTGTSSEINSYSDNQVEKMLISYENELGIAKIILGSCVDEDAPIWSELEVMTNKREVLLKEMGL